LLAKLVSKIGWDELLRTRSTVFVMEEEYRAQKAAVTVQQMSIDENPESSRESAATPKARENGRGDADDDASIRGIAHLSPGAGSDKGLSPITPEIPVIKISTESDREQEHHETDRPEAQLNGEHAQDTIPGPIVQHLEKPETAAASTEDGDDGSATLAEDGHQDSSYSFSNKRLCERWLDNLFMVLYEVIQITLVYGLSLTSVP
jgi:Chs5-Arf1p-binding protein BUD7/BCH1